MPRGPVMFHGPGDIVLDPRGSAGEPGCGLTVTPQAAGKRARSPSASPELGTFPPGAALSVARGMRITYGPSETCSWTTTPEPRSGRRAQQKYHVFLAPRGHSRGRTGPPSFTRRGPVSPRRSGRGALGRVSRNSCVRTTASTSAALLRTSIAKQVRMSKHRRLESAARAPCPACACAREARPCHRQGAGPGGTLCVSQSPRGWGQGSSAGTPRGRRE